MRIEFHRLGLSLLFVLFFSAAYFTNLSSQAGNFFAGEESVEFVESEDDEEFSDESSYNFPEQLNDLFDDVDKVSSTERLLSEADYDFSYKGADSDYEESDYEEQEFDGSDQIVEQEDVDSLEHQPDYTEDESGSEINDDISGLEKEFVSIVSDDLIVQPKREFPLALKSGELVNLRVSGSGSAAFSVEHTAGLDSEVPVRLSKRFLDNVDKRSFLDDELVKALLPEEESGETVQHDGYKVFRIEKSSDDGLKTIFNGDLVSLTVADFSPESTPENIQLSLAYMKKRGHKRFVPALVSWKNISSLARKGIKTDSTFRIVLASELSGKDGLSKPVAGENSEAFLNDDSSGVDSSLPVRPGDSFYLISRKHGKFLVISDNSLDVADSSDSASPVAATKVRKYRG